MSTEPAWAAFLRFYGRQSARGQSRQCTVPAVQIEWARTLFFLHNAAFWTTEASNTDELKVFSLSILFSASPRLISFLPAPFFLSFLLFFFLFGVVFQGAVPGSSA